MTLNKIIGYILLAAGLLLIGWTLWQSYNIFTAKVSAPLVFKTSNLGTTSKSGGILDLQKQLEDTIKQQLGNILPADTLPKILNLVSWSILAGILIFGGGQISGLGIKLITK